MGPCCSKMNEEEISRYKEQQSYSKYEVQEEEYKRKPTVPYAEDTPKDLEFYEKTANIRSPSEKINVNLE